MKLDKFKYVDFSKFTSIKIGGISKVFIIDTIQDIQELGDFKIIGGGNNLLISPNPQIQLAILSKKFDFIKLQGSEITIGASTQNGKIFNFAKTHNIGGFEFIQNIPSTLGGMVKMNAGMKEFEISNNLVSIKTDKGLLAKNEIEFHYRYSNIKDVILEATFKINSQFSKILVQEFLAMRLNQPKYHSAGSTFKNPKNYSAGKLIQDVGLKGFQIGNMAFSEIHGNFLVNLGGGNFEDALKLIKLAEKQVFEKFEIELKREVCIIETD
jgi:UDP-N-acetylmuramate dehydrogenase